MSDETTSFGPTLINPGQILGGGGSGGIAYTAGPGISIGGSSISVRADGSTVTTDSSGRLTVIGGGSGTVTSVVMNPESAVYSGNSGSSVSAPVISGKEYAEVYRNGLLMASGTDYVADFSSAMLSFSTPLVSSETVTAVVYGGGSAAAPEYSAGPGIGISVSNVISAKVDHSTIRVSSGTMYSPALVGSGGIAVSQVSSGSAVSNIISALVDGSTVSVNASGQLAAAGGGGQEYSAGPGIEISGGSVSAASSILNEVPQTYSGMSVFLDQDSLDPSRGRFNVLYAYGQNNSVGGMTIREGAVDISAGGYSLKITNSGIFVSSGGVSSAIFQ